MKREMVNKFLLLALLSFGTFLTCVKKASRVPLPSGAEVITGRKGRTVVDYSQRDSISAIGRLYYDNDTLPTVLVGYRLIEFHDMIATYKDAMKHPDSLGVMLIVTTADDINDFIILNYESPDSAFYANRLAIGGRSLNILVDKGMTLSRLKVYDRR